jgi:Tol biopolymer transport system component
VSLERLAAALADRYRLERELGAGGMATVYLAADLKHHRQVAIKVLRPELAAVLGADRFVQEITTTAQLQHPHILPLFDSGSADSFLYYVMPYVEGETLRSKLDREKQLGVDEAVKITSEVADALDYAHRHGVIHRDIKPENILLHDGRPMVADFGIALAVSAAAGGRMTETGLSLGTPHYMSPEQATADRDITARSDIYSLASVLYEMLTGNPPHTGASAQQIIMKIIAEPVPMVASLRKSVPPNVAAALTKALEKLPADRFESAKAFAEALGNPGFTVGTTAATGIGPAALESRRLVLLLASLTFVATIAALWGWLRAPPAGHLAGVVRFSVPLAPDSGGARSVTIPRAALTSRLAFSPDGSLLVYAALDNGRVQLYARRMDREPEVLLAASDSAQYTWPFFSPDGAWLGFQRGGADRRLQRMSLANRSVETIGLLDSLGLTAGFAWGDDGTIVVATGSRLYRIPASGGRWTVLAEAHPPAGQALRWSQPLMLPGSRILLFQAARSYDPAQSDIVALTLATGAQGTVLANAMDPLYVPGGYLLFVREGTLMGVRFDPERAEVHGDPVVLISDVLQSLYQGGSNLETGAAHVAVSAAGHLAYARGGVTRPPLSRVVRLTPRGDTIPIPMEPRNWGFFRLSPDGTRLAALSFRGQETQIWVHDLARGVTARRTTGAFSNFPFAWSPDGRWLAFTSDRDTPGLMNLYRMPSDGSGAPQRLFSSDSNQFVADWSSQGVLAFLQCDLAETNCDVGVIPPDSAPRPFLATPANEFWPAFSPDGRWLAYTSDESGRWEVYMRPYPAGGPPTQVSAGGGGWPMWSRDGRVLIYYQPTPSKVWAVDVAPGPEFRAGRARPYAVQWSESIEPIRGTDVFPDGSVVLPIPDTSAPPPPQGATEIEVILNFLAELQQRVGRAQGLSR